MSTAVASGAQASDGFSQSAEPPPLPSHAEAPTVAPRGFYGMCPAAVRFGFPHATRSVSSPHCTTPRSDAAVAGAVATRPVIPTYLPLRRHSLTIMLSRKVGLDFDHGKLVVPELDKLLAAGGLEVAEWRVQDLGLGREGGEPLQVSAVLHTRGAEE